MFCFLKSVPCWVAEIVLLSDNIDAFLLLVNHSSKASIELVDVGMNGLNCLLCYHPNSSHSPGLPGDVHGQQVEFPLQVLIWVVDRKPASKA